jgi:hypothetical protein
MEDHFKRLEAELEGGETPPAEPEPTKPTAADARGDKPWRQHFVPDGEIGKILGERENERGEKEVNFQIVSLDENGNEIPIESGYMTVPQALSFAAKKWGYAHLDLNRKTLDEQYAPAPAAPPQPAAPEPPKPTDGFADLGLGLTDTETGYPQGHADALGGVLPMEASEPAAIEPLAGQPPAQQAQFATIPQMAEGAAEEKRRLEWDGKNRQRIESAIYRRMKREAEESEEPIDQGEFHAAVAERVEREFKLYADSLDGKQALVAHKRNDIESWRNEWREGDIAAEMALGPKAGPAVLAPVSRFYDRVLVAGYPPQTPEERFLATNNNWTNGRLLTGLAMRALTMGREMSKKLAEAEQRGRLAEKRAQLDAWRGARESMAKAGGGSNALEEAARRAQAPGAASPEPATSFATPGGTVLPPTEAEEAEQEWAKFQRAISGQT